MERRDPDSEEGALRVHPTLLPQPAEPSGGSLPREGRCTRRPAGFCRPNASSPQCDPHARPTAPSVVSDNRGGANTSSGRRCVQIVLVTCGAPGVGKSTWAEAQALPIASPDHERARLGNAANQGFNPVAWQRVRERIEGYVAAGKPPLFIVDGTFAARGDRKSIMRTIGPTARRVLVVFPMDRERAHRQNQSQTRVVPPTVVDHFMDNLEESLPKVGTEGWDLVWDVEHAGPWGGADWTPEWAELVRACGWPAPSLGEGRQAPAPPPVATGYRDSCRR